MHLSPTRLMTLCNAFNPLLRIKSLVAALPRMIEIQAPVWIAMMVLGLAIAPSSFVSAQEFNFMGGQEPEGPTEEDIALMTPVIRQFDYGELEAMSVDELRKLYDGEIESMREIIKQLRRCVALYFHVTSDEAYDYAKKWKEWAEKGKQTNQRIKEISLVLFLKTEDPDKDLASVTALMCEQSFKEGRLGICYPVTQKLRTVFPDQQELIDDEVRLAAYNNDFSTAAEYVKKNSERVSDWTMFEQVLFSDIEKKIEIWEAELAIRAEEEKADDLPRVEMVTSKGKIVIELFENEVPHTVGNFISLVEKNFYNDLIFHLVVRNYRAQGGVLLMDRARNTGYKVIDEGAQPNARNIFRGSVCMVSPKATKGASEFFINVSPEPILDYGDRPTVIGRVIEGIEVVESLNVTAKITVTGQPEFFKEVQPDHVVSTKVLRKRPGSNYVPKIAEK